MSNSDKETLKKLVSCFTLGLDLSYYIKQPIIQPDKEALSVQSRCFIIFQEHKALRGISQWTPTLQESLKPYTHENTINELFNKSSFLKLRMYLILTKGRWSFFPPLLTTDLAISQHPHYERKNCYRSSLSQSNCSYNSIFFLLWLSSPHTILKMTWQGKHNTSQAVKNLTN